MSKLIFSAGAGLLILCLCWQSRLLSAEAEESRASTLDPTIAAESCVVVAEGRLVARPGAHVTLAAEAPGRLTAVLVTEQTRVVAGQLIAELDADEEQAMLQHARACLAGAEAEVTWAQGELTRSENLARQEFSPAQVVDRARRDCQQALARRDQASAEIERLEAGLRKMRIVAPIDGVVLERQAEPGETLEIGAPVATIADLERTWIEAEVDEFDAERVHVGDPVRIQVEGSTTTHDGSIEEIPEAVVTRRLRPGDPGRPTDTRVLLVKIKLEKRTTIKLHQRVEVAIRTGDREPLAR